MKIRNIHVLVMVMAAAAVLCLVSLGTGNAQVAAGSAVGANRVGVCDVAKVLSEYQRAKDLRAEFDKRRQSIQAENQKRLNALEQLKTEMEGYKVGSDKHSEILEKMRRQEIERQVWLKMKDDSTLREYIRLMTEMYNQIRLAVAAVAKGRGIGLVLQLERDQLNPRTPQDLVVQIDRRKVLYNSPQVDITAEVLQRINETYRVQKK